MTLSDLERREVRSPFSTQLNSTVDLLASQETDLRTYALTVLPTAHGNRHGEGHVCKGHGVRCEAPKRPNFGGTPTYAHNVCVFGRPACFQGSATFPSEVTWPPALHIFGGSHLLMLTPLDGVYNTRRAYLRRVSNANAYCANALRGFVSYI